MNSTTLFRLVERLAEVGYPAHWLSGILVAVCSGVVFTTARAPRRLAVGGWCGGVERVSKEGG
jgi:hypothetical protein